MPYFVTAPEMPIVVEYPDHDYAPAIADFYERMIETKRCWPYYLGQDGDEGAVVVNFGRLTGVTVSTSLPEGWTKPVRKSLIEDDVRDTDIYADVRFSNMDDPAWMDWPAPWRWLAEQGMQLRDWATRSSS